MYLFTRTGRFAPGHLADSLAWATAMKERVTAGTDLEVGLFAHTFSPALGTIAFTAFVPDLAVLEAANATLMADPDYHRAVDEGAAFLAEGMDDALIQLVHGEPDPSRSAQYVTTVQTVCANGMFARGVEVGVQLAQHAEKVTGGPTLFGVNVTGAYGSVGWITPHATIGDLESAQQALMADPDWLAMVDRDAGSAYAADPAASSQTVWRNLA
jgi:hypothetical protein